MFSVISQPYYFTTPDKKKIAHDELLFLFVPIIVTKDYRLNVQLLLPNTLHKLKQVLELSNNHNGENCVATRDTKIKTIFVDCLIIVICSMNNHPFLSFKFNRYSDQSFDNIFI